jgi:hypothetical protein
MGMTFIAGGLIGGLIASMLVYAYLKGKYEMKIEESYNKGYKNGREIEQRAIFDYIEQLNSDANACIYNNGPSKDGEV